MARAASAAASESTTSAFQVTMTAASATAKANSLAMGESGCSHPRSDVAERSTVPTPIISGLPRRR